MSKILGILVWLFTILLCIEFSLELSVNEYLSLSLDQKLKLDLFRDRMKARVPHDYMKKDIYLIRWLRDSNFDIAAAERRLYENIKWREENDIDSILDEDWSDFDHEFKVYVEGCSRDGNLVVSMSPGDWDVRRNVILPGKTERFMRYINKVFEESDRMLRRMQDDGQNVTQATMLFDVTNFNLVQQGCPRCVPLYLYLVTTWEKNFPGTVHKVYFVNAPRLSIPLWQLVKNVLQPQTRDAIFFYTKDRTDWSKALFQEISKDQLSRTFLGTKKEALDLQDLRRTDEVYRCDSYK